jgi:archaellum component FlaC
MVGRGFSEVDKRFDGVGKRFDAVEERLERIEKLILADHKRRIERLETEMKDLRDMLAVK